LSILRLPATCRRLHFTHRRPAAKNRPPVVCAGRFPRHHPATSRSMSVTIVTIAPMPIIAAAAIRSTSPSSCSVKRPGATSRSTSLSIRFTAVPDVMRDRSSAPRDHTPQAHMRATNRHPATQLTSSVMIYRDQPAKQGDDDHHPFAACSEYRSLSAGRCLTPSVAATSNASDSNCHLVNQIPIYPWRARFMNQPSRSPCRAKRRFMHVTFYVPRGSLPMTMIGTSAPAIAG
jgi:hypothetical protein